MGLLENVAKGICWAGKTPLLFEVQHGVYWDYLGRFGATAAQIGGVAEWAELKAASGSYKRIAIVLRQTGVIQRKIDCCCNSKEG
jgi:hypothetical protein